MNNTWVFRNDALATLDLPPFRFELYMPRPESNDAWYATMRYGNVAEIEYLDLEDMRTRDGKIWMAKDFCKQWAVERLAQSILDVQGIATSWEDIDRTESEQILELKNLVQRQSALIERCKEIHAEN